MEKVTISIRGLLRAILALLIFLILTQAVVALSEGEVKSFSYTGSPQEFEVPKDGTYELRVWGAQGGDSYSGIGGSGGYSEGQINLNQGNSIMVYVGGEGEDATSAGGGNGGWNGGGHGGTGGDAEYRTSGGGGGGGSDIRINGTTLSDRIIVAGGGGGAGGDRVEDNARGAGGGGGSGYYGGGGGESDLQTPAGGGTQSSGGEAGDDGCCDEDGESGSWGSGGDGGSTSPSSQSGSGNGNGGGDGGGSQGEDGHIGDDWTGGGGGGGSGYLDESLEKASMETGVNTGHGRVEIELVETGSNDLIICDYRGPFNECLSNQTHTIGNQIFNITSIYEAQSNAAFEALNGQATLNITNSTFLSGFWRGSFRIDTTKEHRATIKPGADFRPENGDIVIGK